MSVLRTNLNLDPKVLLVVTLTPLLKNKVQVETGRLKIRINTDSISLQLQFLKVNTY